MNIIDTYINPMIKFGNAPYLVIVVDHSPNLHDAIYNNTENCFWYQENGITDFLFHSPIEGCTRITDDYYQTPKSEGYGGRIFNLKVNYQGRVVRVDLRGPWSGGSYCANQYLPEPSIEVTYNVKQQFGTSHIAGHMTWSMVQSILPEGWSVIDSRWNNKHWPELIYKGEQKKDWNIETINGIEFIHKTKSKRYRNY